MNSLGSYLENPHFDYRTIKEAVNFFGDALRINSTSSLSSVSSSANEDLIKLRQTAMEKNSFTEEMISKFEINLINLLIATSSYERKILKFYDLPDIFIKAAKGISGFELKRQYFPDRLVMNISHTTITMLPYGSDAPYQFDLSYNIWDGDWFSNESITPDPTLKD